MGFPNSKKRGSNKPITDQEIDQIVLAYTSERASLRGLSKKYSRSEETIKRILIEKDVDFRSHSWISGEIVLTEAQKKTIVDRYKAGDSVNTLALANGCSIAPIRRILRDSNTPIRDWEKVMCIRRNLDGCKHFGKSLYGGLESGARSRKIHWNITPDDIENIYLSQEGLCFYTKLKMATAYRDIDVKGIRGSPLRISLDRRDSDFGYTKDNIVLCCQFVNLAKNAWSESLFKNILQQAVESLSPNAMIPKFNPWGFGV